MVLIRSDASVSSFLIGENAENQNDQHDPQRADKVETNAKLL